MNGDHSSIGRAAVSYQHRSFDRRDMTALFMAADVVLVTALRDGMNLVAKEYVASRPICAGCSCSASSPARPTSCGPR
ncbi:trehalose-6-phosphate synthase [Brachybacterium sacelli]|uniref:trehalose-6-phosphate synthase n=1 Tax=Brachybacterium sacelli TaxID=173364 RepID=UPI00361880D7